MKSTIKKLLAGALTATMLFSPLSYATDEGTYGFQNFKKQQEYTKNTFTDITADWIHQAVKPSYELGLVSGQGNKKYKPNANVTLAEAISLAARIHDLYTGGDGIMEQVGSSWYDGAVLYAVDHNIIKAGAYPNFQKDATRAQMADIFAHALPEDGYTSINQIDQLPDVTMDMVSSDSIFALYQAGILSGNDEYGTFHPDSNTKRSEVAVIVARIADPSLRKAIVLRPTSTKTATETTYTAKSNRFTLTTPRAWKEAGIYSSTYNSLELFGPKDLQRISIIETEKSGSDTLNSFSDTFISNMKASLENSAVSPYEPLTLNGTKALSCAVTGTLSDVALSFHFVILDGGDRYFIINGCTPQDTDAEFLTQFQTIIATFKLVK